MGILGDIFGGIGEIFNVQRSDQAAKAADQQYRTNLMMQDMYNRQGLQIKAADARAAEAASGINALSLLGVSGPTWSSVVGDTSRGGNVAKIGKSFGDAADELLGEKNDLDNEYKRAQIDFVKAKTLEIMRPGTAPVIPSQSVMPGQSNTAPDDSAKVDPWKVYLPSSVNPGMGPYINPDVEHDRSLTGGTIPQPREKSILSIDPVSPIQWNMRNRILEWFPWTDEYEAGVRTQRPARQGYRWYMDPLTGQWKEIKRAHTRDRWSDFYERGNTFGY